MPVITDRPRTAGRPGISGPANWPAAAPPPRFSVDVAGMPLYMVELATDHDLMRSIADRTPDNYFFGGDAESVFSTGASWCMPATVWRQLSRARLLYYRVVTFDQASGAAELSVDDQDLGALPAVVIERRAVPDLRPDALRAPGG